MDVDERRAEELDPEVRSLVEMVESLGVLPISQYEPEQAREMLSQFDQPGAGPDVETEDATARAGDREVPVRVYRPRGDGPHPTVVYYHGGGFVLGDLDGVDPTCRHLCAATDAAVVSVDYALAPEEPFPAAVEDAYAALEWADGDPGPLDAAGPLAVAGDSAGGTLSAVVSLVARDQARGFEPAVRLAASDDPAAAPEVDHQSLVYPSVSADDGWDSREENAEGYYLYEADMEWFGETYLGSPVHGANPYAFPMNARDLSGLPPATVLTAGYDPLRDEAIAYADRLAEAGVAVTHHHYPGAIHGFFGMVAPPASLSVAAEAIEDVAGDLRAALGVDDG